MDTTQMTATGLLFQFPENKAQQSVFVDKLVQSVRAGIADPIRAEAAMTNLEQVVKAYRSNGEVRAILMSALEKEGGRVVTPDAKLEIVETGTIYGYEESKTWRDLDDEIERLTLRRKAIEAALKNATEDTPYADPATGELITHIGKTSRKAVKVTILRGE